MYTLQKTSLIAVGREYWMIYRRPGFLAVVWFGPPRPSSPFLLLSRQEARPATHGKTCWREWGGEGRGWWGRNRFVRPQESLVFYKSFNTLYQQRWERSSVKCSMHSKWGRIQKYKIKKTHQINKKIKKFAGWTRRERLRHKPLSARAMSGRKLCRHTREPVLSQEGGSILS